MTFLKFQEKPRGSNVFYVYEYRSFRDRDQNRGTNQKFIGDPHNYGKVRHSLVAYHGRADKALKKLADRALEFSPRTWKKILHYAKISRKPDQHPGEKTLTTGELRFLAVLSDKNIAEIDSGSGEVRITFSNMAELIHFVENIDLQEATTILQDVVEDEIMYFKLANEIKYCVFPKAAEYFSVRDLVSAQSDQL